MRPVCLLLLAFGAAPRDAGTADPMTRSSCDGRSACDTQCRAGDSAACSKLGSLYETGTGTTKSFDGSAFAYAQGCDKNEKPDALSCAGLGRAAELGRGVKPNGLWAAHYDAKACDLGDAASCLHLAEKYETGHGVPKDAAKAAQWRQRARAPTTSRPDGGAAKK